MDLSRRDSIAVSQDNIFTCISQALTDLRRIWHHVGLDEQSRAERMDTAENHIKELTKMMVSEELEMQQTIESNIERFKPQVEKLAELLEVPVTTEFPPDTPLVEVELALRSQEDALRSERHQRRKAYLNMAQEHKKIAAELCIESNYLAKAVSGPSAAEDSSRSENDHTQDVFPPNFVPTLATLEQLRKDVDTKRILAEERRQEILSVRRRAKKLVRQMSGAHITVASLDTFGARLLGDDYERLPLTDGTMDYLRTYEAELEDRYELFMSEMRSKIVSVRNHLIDLWEKCCVPEAIRAGFPLMDEDNFDSTMMQHHQEEIAELEKVYESRKVILDELERWKDLFAKKVEFEKRDDDPNKYYDNRGAALLHEQKAMKLNGMCLAKTQRCLVKLVNDWQARNGAEFLAYGVPILEYIENEQRAWETQKAAERDEKLRKKKEQREQERLYGAHAVPSSPRPGVLGARNTPGRNCTMRLNTTRAKTPGASGMGGSRFIHSSIRMAMAASPTNFRPPLPPAPSRPTGSAKKHNIQKRRPDSPNATPVKKIAFDENEEIKVNVQSPCGVDHQSTFSSMASYGEFKMDLRSKPTMQSSFIVSPKKMAKH